MTTQSQTAAMDRWYRHQAPWFDLSRRALLWGRGQLARWIPAGSQVCELGCGTGHNLAALRQAVGSKGRVLGIDCCATLLDRARRRCPSGVSLVRGEFPQELPAQARFDVLVCSYALSMQADPAVLLPQLRARLRPGGRLVLLDFEHSPWPWLRRRMLGPCPGMDSGLFAAARLMGEVCHDQAHRAWAGLWSYRLLVVRSAD